jgi:hypothetical protein
MNEQQNQQEKEKQNDKELKRLFDAHILVLKDKLGRTPTMEEVQESLSKDDSTEAATPIASESPEQGEPSQPVSSEGTDDLQKVDEEVEAPEPKILGTKVYYGMTEGKPDPDKVLFYETPDNSCYCTESKEWLTERPSVLDHLASRPMHYKEKDIVAAIAHGVMDDNDYDALEKAGMVTETPKQLWSLMKKLKSQTEELEKSQASYSEDSDDDESESDDFSESEVDTDYTHEGHGSQAGEDVLKYFLNTAGVDESKQEDLIEAVGEDALSRIMEAASQIALSGLEDQIRRIVREELNGSSGDSEELEYDVEPEGQYSDDEEEEEEEPSELEADIIE